MPDDTDNTRSPIDKELGPYQIESLLGEGGMGQVYKARDTRLGRTVAIKVLPHDRAADLERKKRFLQEARAASSLNHPNIVTLHDIASHEGIDYLVMEYVPGQSLDKLIAAKRLTQTDAVNYAQQVASALAAAHAAGIVHRDIKPANVVVSGNSQVKVLDFGLAKLLDHSTGAEDETRTQGSTLTEAGTVMGTVAYMSPEQATANTVDHRTDIFSLGVMLYEMLAGARPFRGKSKVETLHAIINDSPATIPSVPPELQEIVDQTLSKTPADRYQHAGDMSIDLRRFQKAWESKSLPSQRSGTSARPVRRGAWLAVAAAIAVCAALAGWWTGRRGTAPIDNNSLADISITPFTSEPGYQGEPSISPDGQTIAYVSDRAGRFDIYLRQVGSSSDVALTHNQEDNIQPTFSPDGREIAFVSSRSGGAVVFHPCCDSPIVGGTIWTMPSLGGAVAARRVVEDGSFPAWSPDGSTIVFTRYRQGSLFQAPSGGGEVKELPMKFESARPAQLIMPVFTSDGRWIIFASFSSLSDYIYAVPSGGGKVLELARGRHPAWDSSSQSVLYVNTREGKNNSLWELPFSTTDGKRGTPRPLTVGRGSDWRPAVSRDGKLIAYSAVTQSFNLELEPFDAEAGKVLGPPRPITSGKQIDYFMRFSPDAKSIVVQSSRGAGTHIWRLDVGGEAVRLTSDSRYEEQWPALSPDGTTISFVRNPLQTPNMRSLWLMASDGANPRQIAEGVESPPRWLPNGELLYCLPGQTSIGIRNTATGQTRNLPVGSMRATMVSASADGKWAVFQATPNGMTNQDVGAVPLGGGEARIVYSSPHQEMHPFFSPSGRWLYFQWDHKNLYRVPGPAQDWKKADVVKVTNFPETAGLFLEDPQISNDGKQLLFSRGNISSDIWILKRAK